MLVDFGKASYIDKARQQPEKVRMVLEKIKTDGLMTGLRDASKRTAQFVDLVQRFTVQGDASAARDLAAFQVGAGADELINKCETDASRLASGVLGALNGLDE